MKKQVKSLLETVGQVLIGAITDKKLLVEDDELKSRLIICDPCENLDRDNSACKKCGCRITYKARLKKAKCPIGRW